MRAPISRLFIALGLLLSLAPASRAVTPGPAPILAEPNPWVVSFLDVGQGDSTLMHMPTGEWVLIDGGDVDAGETVVADLRARGVKALDLLIMTHPHADHVGGLQAVIERFPVRLALDAGVSYASRTYGRVLDGITRLGVPLKLGRAGMHKDYGEVSMDVLAPEEPLLEGTRSDVNNASIVTRWRFRDVVVLATGDAEQESLDRLMSKNVDLRAAVLKVPHHGSRYTMSAKFLSLVKPRAAVISCGLHNDYHHPHKEALARLKAVGAQTFITAQSGTVTLTTDGHQLVFRTGGDKPVPVASPGHRRSHARRKKP